MVIRPQLIFKLWEKYTLETSIGIPALNSKIS